MSVSEWLSPVLVTAGLAAIGWMLRYIFSTITDKLDDLEATFTKVTGELASEHRALAREFVAMDRRVIRLESWRDLVELLEHGSGHGV